MLTLPEISHIRLCKQLIVQPSFLNPKECVRWMGAMQAQNYGMAKWAVGLRVQNSSDKQIEEAVNKGEIIRTHLLRPTWHFVAVDDVRWMMELSAPNINKLARSAYRQVELDDTVFKKSNQVLEKVLSGRNELTREEIRIELEREGIKTNESRFLYLMLRAEIDMVVCSGARQGKQSTYALFDEKIPDSKSMLKEEALVRLIKIYLSSRGPATLKDFIWWSGLSSMDAKAALEMVKSDFVSEIVGAETFWLNPSDLNQKGEDASVHLLPAFDEFMISYKDRTASIVMENQFKAFTKNGIFHPVVVSKGQVIGLWKKSKNKKGTTFQYDFFQPPDKHQRKMITRCEQRFSDFNP